MYRRKNMLAAGLALCLLLLPATAQAAGNGAGEEPAASEYALVGAQKDGPRVTTETAVNKDGSITTTATNLDSGMVTAVTRYTDGGILTVETQKDGRVTTTRQDADGTMRREVKRPDGTVSVTQRGQDGTTVDMEADTAGLQVWTVGLTREAVEKAREKGSAVRLPIDALETSSSMEKAPSVCVVLPQGGTVEVELPLRDAGAGTVVYCSGEEESGWTAVASFQVEQDCVRFEAESGVLTKAVNAAASFPDVKRSDWFCSAVDFCSARGLLQGTGGGRFSPDETLSRAMLVTVLHRMAGEPVAEGSGVFSDVPAGAYYAAAVNWAAGWLVQGDGEGHFSPEEPVTREQMAVLLWRYAGSPASKSGKLTFRDTSQASAYAVEALCWAQEQGILSGKGNSRLDPLGSAKRSEAAQLLQNFVQTIG